MWRKLTCRFFTVDLCKNMLAPNSVCNFSNLATSSIGTVQYSFTFCYNTHWQWCWTQRNSKRQSAGQLLPIFINMYTILWSDILKNIFHVLFFIMISTKFKLEIQHAKKQRSKVKITRSTCLFPPASYVDERKFLCTVYNNIHIITLKISLCTLVTLE